MTDTYEYACKFRIISKRHQRVPFLKNSFAFAYLSVSFILKQIIVPNKIISYALNYLFLKITILF